MRGRPMSQTMWSQAKACITRWSCEICAVLRHYAVHSSNSVPTFWDNPSVSSLWVNKSKRENREWLKLTDTIFFGTLSLIIFFKAWHFWWMHVFRQRHPTWRTLSLSYSQSLGNIDMVNLLSYAPENKSSPRILTGKWLLKN